MLHRDKPATSPAAGVAMGMGAHLVWGLFPLYFLLVEHVAPTSILAWRVLHAAIAMAVMASVVGLWPKIAAAVRDRRTLVTLLGSAALVGLNWLIFIYAVLNGRALEAALGYFITPLFIVFLGIVFLGERPRPVQLICIGLAVVGVVIKTWLTGTLPWVALALPLTFGFYSLLRKVTTAPSQVAMTVETFVLMPLGTIYLMIGLSLGREPTDVPTLGWLALSGLLTVTPLLLFGGAATRLTMTTLGFIQYLGPTCQMILAATVLGETIEPGDWWAFGLIWSALLLFSLDAARRHRSARVAQP